jgi:hypothetical protein
MTPTVENLPPLLETGNSNAFKRKETRKNVKADIDWFESEGKVLASAQ